MTADRARIGEADLQADREARASRRLDELVTTCREALYLRDADPLIATMAAVAANLAPGGDPVWLMVVGPSGSGKTEILRSLGGLPHVHHAGTITEAALLSGSPKRETSAESTGGLLREVGPAGVLVLKDFTSIVSMHRDARAGLLAALREIYDGSWTRRLGTDGGKTLHWEGRLGVIAACTPVIDTAHEVQASMGERFAYCRVGVDNPHALADMALRHSHETAKMRSELEDAVRDLFDRCDLAESPRPLDSATRARLIHLAEFTTRSRSAVQRDGYRRDIEAVIEPEAPTRFATMLARLIHGAAVIGADDATAWRVAQRVAFDSIPRLRFNVLRTLIGYGGSLPIKDIAATLNHPTTTVRRTIEDLECHGLVVNRGDESRGEFAASRWATETHAAATFPETSDGSNHPDHTYDDISGKPGRKDAR